MCFLLACNFFHLLLLPRLCTSVSWYRNKTEAQQQRSTQLLTVRTIHPNKADIKSSLSADMQLSQISCKRSSGIGSRPNRCCSAMLILLLIKAISFSLGRSCVFIPAYQRACIFCFRLHLCVWGVFRYYTKAKAKDNNWFPGNIISGVSQSKSTITNIPEQFKIENRSGFRLLWRCVLLQVPWPSKKFSDKVHAKGATPKKPTD